MKVLFINNGEADRITSQKVYTRLLPRFVIDRLKSHVALAPSQFQRALIGGFGIGEKRFPLGLGYLSAMLKPLGHQVELVDRFADPGSWVSGDIRSYDFVGVYSSSPFFGDCLAILDRLEREGYRGPIAFGGPHATTFPRTIPPRVDYVVQGEAEYIIHDLVMGKFSGQSVIRTPRIDDLDDLPRADFDLFMDKPRSYLNHFEFSDRKPIFNLSTSRSCPLACSFCGVRDIWGRLWRAQSAERVLDDIFYLKKTYGIAGVYFREDLFTGNPKRVREISEGLIKAKADIVWACETRVDVGADEELVKVMAQSGCRGFYIGAESGSQKMLDHYNKQISVEQIYQTCRHAKKYGVAIYMSLIVAHPKETFRDKLETWKLLQRTRPQTFGLAPYRAEFARHGTVDYPEYPLRETIIAERGNSTWVGQTDRFSYLGVDPPARVAQQ